MSGRRGSGRWRSSRVLGVTVGANVVAALGGQRRPAPGLRARLLPQGGGVGLDHGAGGARAGAAAGARPSRLGARRRTLAVAARRSRRAAAWTARRSRVEAIHSRARRPRPDGDPRRRRGRRCGGAAPAASYAGLHELRVTATRGADRYVDHASAAGRARTVRAVIALVGPVLAASLLGSPHCAGMCGGFVCFYCRPGRQPRAGPPRGLQRRPAAVLPRARRGRRRCSAPASTGSAPPPGIARAAAIAAGVADDRLGRHRRCCRARGVRIPGLHLVTVSRTARWIGAAARARGSRRRCARSLLGLLHDAAALRLALRLRRHRGRHRLVPLGGVAVMAAFWLGTVPVMAGLGLRGAAGLRSPAPAPPDGDRRGARRDRPAHRDRTPARPCRMHGAGCRPDAPAWPVADRAARADPAADGHLRPLRAAGAAGLVDARSRAAVLLQRLPHRLGASSTTAGLERYYRFASGVTAPVASSGALVRGVRPPGLRGALRAEPPGRAPADRALPRGRALRLLRVAGGARPAGRPRARSSAELDVTAVARRLAWDPARRRRSPRSRASSTRSATGRTRSAGVKAEAIRRAEDRAMLTRIGVAGAIAGNVMMIAPALYAGWFGGMDASHRALLPLGEPAAHHAGDLLAGPRLLPGRLAALRTRPLHMDVPIALALAAGYLARRRQHGDRPAGRSTSTAWRR